MSELVESSYEAPQLRTRSYEKPALRRLAARGADGKNFVPEAEGAVTPSYGPS